MNRFVVFMSSLLLVGNFSFASDLTSSLISSEDFADCTTSHPCYYKDGQFHHLDSDDPWNSYTIPSFIVNTSIALGVAFAPVAYNAFDRFLDYAAYKWRFWRGLRDSGGLEQTYEFRRMANAAEGIGNDLRLTKNYVEKGLLSEDKQRSALEVVSETIVNNFTQTNFLLTQVIQEMKQEREATLQLIQSLNQQQEEKTETLVLAIQKSQQESIGTLAVNMQESQRKNNEALVASFTEALKELKSKDS